MVLEFVSDGPYSVGLDVAINGEASGNPDTFGGGSWPFQRPRTHNTVEWLIPVEEAWDLGQIHQTPDFTRVVQEIVDRADWNSGNALVVLLANDGPTQGAPGHRRMLAFERAMISDDWDPPSLSISYGPPPIEPPNLAVSLAAPSTALPGDPFTYDLVVRNNGAGRATGVGLSLDLPSEVSFVSQTYSLPPTQVGQSLAWSLASLESGASISIEVGVQVFAAAPLGTVLATDAAVVAADEVDLSDNTDSASTTLQPPPPVGPTDPDHSSLTADRTRVTADGVDLATLTVTLRDASDNPIPDHDVELVHPSADVSITPLSGTSDAQGTVVFTASSARAQQVRFSARDTTENVELTSTVVVSFVSTDPDLSTAVIDPAEVLADGVQSATLTATLRNPSGAPMVGVEVSLTVSPNQGVAIDGVPAPAGPVSLGLTDDQGIVTAQISATRAGLKTLTVRDETEGVTLTQRPTVNFLPGPPDAARSVVTAIDRVVAADGLAQSLVLVTVSDAFGNRVAGATVALLTSGNAVPIQPAARSDSLGQARGYVTDVKVETVTVRATADGVLIDDSDTITFRGADLALTKTGQALSNYDGPSDEFALAGGTITYSLSVTNEGLLTAQAVQLVDTLPPDLNYLQNVSGPAPQVDGPVITYSLGTLAVGATQTVEFEASIAEGVLGARTNAAQASTSGQEDVLADNSASLATTVELPRPVLALSRPVQRSTSSRGRRPSSWPRCGTAGPAT